MPNRILREGLITSEPFNELNWESQNLFVRLLLVVDDFGRSSASAKILRPALYPLRLDDVDETAVQRALVALDQSRIIRLYSVSGKPYLEVANFRQRTRAENSKYPPPPDCALHTTANCLPHDGHPSDMCPAHDGLPRTETKTNPEAKTKTDCALARSSSEKKVQLPRPDSPEAAIKFCRGQKIDAPDDFVRRIYTQLNSAEWIDGAGTDEIRNFGAYVAKSWTQHQEERGKRDASGKLAPTGFRRLKTPAEEQAEMLRTWEARNARDAAEAIENSEKFANLTPNGAEEVGE